MECDGFRVPDDLTDDVRSKLAALWPDVAKKENYYTSLKEVILEIDDIPPELTDLECVRIKPIRKVRFVTDDNRDLNRMKDFGEVREFVKTVNQVVMPGYELLGYNQILVETDCCTEMIQGYLDEGWRIIAVMPQPQSRRPDYILVRRSEQ